MKDVLVNNARHKGRGRSGCDNNLQDCDDDSRQVKERILDSAEKLFAEKGFESTTVRQIIKGAGCNIAAVNYYFGSKDELYAEVWKRAFNNAVKRYPPDMGLSPISTAEDKLRVFIKSLLYRMTDTGELGYAGQILLMEITNPTEAIDLVKWDAIEPMQKRMHAILEQLLGKQASQQDIAFCAMSVIHQCIGLGFKRGKLPPPLLGVDKSKLIEALSCHIAIFSLAGIAAVKKRITQS